MGRLIDADVFVESLILCDGLGRKSLESVLSVLKEQPTAYDVEKVVAELHEFSLNTEPYCNEMMREGICTEFTDCDYCKLQRAIEIVRKGGAT